MYPKTYKFMIYIIDIILIMHQLKMLAVGHVMTNSYPLSLNFLIVL